MENQKKINKAKEALLKAQEDRHLRKIQYDAQVEIVEGHRRTTIELEAKAESFRKDYDRAHDLVELKLRELNQLTTEKAETLEGEEKQ